MLRNAILESFTLGVLTDGEEGVALDAGQRRQLLQFFLSNDCAIAQDDGLGDDEIDWEAFAQTVRQVYGCNFQPGNNSTT